MFKDLTFTSWKFFSWHVDLKVMFACLLVWLQSKPTDSLKSLCVCKASHRILRFLLKHQYSSTLTFTVQILRHERASCVSHILHTSLLLGAALNSSSAHGQKIWALPFINFKGYFTGESKVQHDLLRPLHSHSTKIIFPGLSNVQRPMEHSRLCFAGLQMRNAIKNRLTGAERTF